MLVILVPEIPALSFSTVTYEVPVTVHLLVESRLSVTLLAESAVLTTPVRLDPPVRCSVTVLILTAATEPARSVPWR
jgi:hypothetical protein